MTLIYLIGLMGLLSIGVTLAGIVVSRRADSATQERLGQYVGSVSQDQVEESDRLNVQESFVLTQKLENVLEERGLGQSLATDLARADLKITMAEFFALTIITMLATGALAFLIYGGFIMPLIGLIAGFFLPKLFVKMRQRRRLNAFNDQLGDGITLMANGLRAGYSLLQAMESIGTELPPPISMEFRRVVREIGLGVDNDQAFLNLLRRVPSDDLDLMVTAINVQQEIGGNLADILDIIGFVIRERVRIKGEIQVLTAQGQLSGYIISLLPIGMALLLYAMNRPYIERMIFSCEAREVSPELCSQPCGWIMIGIALFGIATGFYAIQRIIDIEV